MYPWSIYDFIHCVYPILSLSVTMPGLFISNLISVSHNARSVYIKSYLCHSQCQVCLYPILSLSVTMPGLFIFSLISVSHNARSVYIQSYLCQPQCQVCLYPILSLSVTCEICLYSVLSLSVTMPGLFISNLISVSHNARSVYIQSYLCQSQCQVCFSTIYIHSSHEQCLISIP